MIILIATSFLDGFKINTRRTSKITQYPTQECYKINWDVAINFLPQNYSKRLSKAGNCN